MKATIEFKKFRFNRETKIFKILYIFYENEEKIFIDVQIFKMEGYTKIYDCYIWLKDNLYLFYQQIEIEVPFQLVNFKFNRRLKPMGISIYE